jgi:ribose transport system permease protein
MKQNKIGTVHLGEFLLNYGIYVAVCIFVIIMSIVSDKFLTTRNIVNIFTQSSVLMIVCIGMSLTMLTKGIDMSVGAVMFLSAAVMWFANKTWDISLPMMCVLGLLVGTSVGVINGVIAAKLNVYPLLTTLATMYACRGLGLSITGSGAALMPMAWGDLISAKVLGIPVHSIAAVLLAVLVQIFLKMTPFGRKIFAVGDSQKTAHEKGIPVTGVKIFVYAMSGLMCGIASIISSSQTMGATASMGDGTEFMAMIAAVMGGTSMAGGKGSVFPGCLIGAVIMSTVSNSLVLLKAPPNAYSVVYAAVIFVVVLLDTIRSRRTRQ